MRVICRGGGHMEKWGTDPRYPSSSSTAYINIVCLFVYHMFIFRSCSLQAVVVPCGITVQLEEAEKKNLIDKCDELVQKLKASGVRVHGDFRDNYSPGWKFNHWELKVRKLLYCFLLFKCLVINWTHSFYISDNCSFYVLHLPVHNLVNTSNHLFSIKRTNHQKH